MNQIDHEGFSTTTLRCIVDHRSNDQALTHDNMYTTNAHNSRNSLRKLRSVRQPYSGTKLTKVSMQKSASTMMNKAALKVLTKAAPPDGRAGTANTTMLIQCICVEVQVKLAEFIDVHTKAVFL
jgi:uncharacterized protein (UPF0303 family)